MITLKGNSVFLRALEPNDLEFIYTIENDESIWSVSNTQAPYSRFVLKQYLENAHQDIFEAKQLRLAICLINSNNAIGLIDLFDFDPLHNRAGIGIVIHNNNYKKLGYGSEALRLLINYSFFQLQLHQIYANISTENKSSIDLFTKFEFELVGIKKQWNKVNNQYKDEAFYQLINTKYQDFEL